jgi:uncharacterized protein
VIDVADVDDLSDPLRARRPLSSSALAASCPTAIYSFKGQPDRASLYCPTRRVARATHVSTGGQVCGPSPSGCGAHLGLSSSFAPKPWLPPMTTLVLVADADGDRTKFFPAIEKKHGEPISSWLERLAELGDAKYREQIAYLRESHGFSQAHANALVMYSRGSTTSKRHKDAAGYFATVDPTAARTAKAIFAAITTAHPDLDLVIAWNQPMLRTATGKYVFGLSTSKNHILLNPFSTGVFEAFRDELQGYDLNKHTFRVPLDWKVDDTLLADMVTARLAEL